VHLLRLAVKQTGIAGSAIGAIVLALLVFRMPGRAPATRSESSAAKSISQANEKQLKDVPDGPWLASRRHFAGITPQCSSPVVAESTQKSPTASKPKALNNAAAGARRHQLWCIPEGEQVRSMMAIVADPVHSHMSLVFDRSLEAITLAAESANYVMDRYWLPWQPVSAGSSEGSKQEEARTDAEPGLLMYRWNGPANQSGESGANGATLLYVFLVSDTSTAGINGDQFSHAVNYINEVCGPNHAMCGGIQPISIMGPTFSGSLYSLRRLTARARTAQSAQQFIAYSGTVSSICAQYNQRLLRDDQVQPGANNSPSSVAECTPFPEYSQVSNLQFKSMVTDTETAVRRFLNTLQGEDSQIDCNKPAQVAILSEAATSYGTASRAARKRLDENEKANQKNDGQEKGNSQKAEKPCYTNFSYPREISSLRNAYTSTVKPSSSSETTNPSAQNYLPFDLADLQPNRSDEPPDFSNHQGPLSKEAVLMDFADDMRREHYKYIGIIGSNVLDVMFLASFLRTACPDIRLFVLNPDLLFERDSDNAPYIGTLALGTYPMFGRNLSWTGGGERIPRLPFADQYEEGTFNASLLLIRDIVPNSSGAEPYETDAPFAKASSGSGGLPVWLTVVGTGGFWPVQVIPSADSRSSDPQHMTHSDFSGAWKAIIIILSAVAFLQALVLYFASPLSSRLHDFAVASPACSQRLFFINVGSSNLALCLALAAAPAWRFGSDAEAILLSMIAALAIAVLLCTCGWLYYACARRKENGKPVPRRVPGLSALYFTIWILAVLGAYVWDRLLYGDPGNYGFFFAYRSTHLATGVSPLTPMLPLGLCMYIWSIFEIWRLRFNDSMRPRLATEVGCPGAETDRLIAASVKDYFLDSKYVLAFFVFLLAWLLTLNPVHPFQLFEHPEFGYLYETWFALVVCLMLASGFRLGQIWGQVRKLLRELERSPVRRAFSRLKGENWSPIWQSGGQEEEWTNLSRSFEVLNQLRICNGPLDADLEKAIKDAEGARNEIHELFYLARGQKDAKTTSLPPDKLPKTGEELVRRMQETFTQIQERLASVLNHALRVLQQYWSTHILEADESADQGSDKAGKEPVTESKGTQPALLLEKYVAIRYMAFIRAVLVHVKLLLIFLAISFSLMLISLNVYSFEPHQSLIWSFTAIFAVIGVTALAVLAEAHRNEILSRISGTKPNELGLSFYVRIASLGAAPLFTLLATHFPSIGRFLVSFFQPGLEALK
jgi:hypothetical protein